MILKGRQQGLSKEIDADQLADCVKKATNAVVISHEKEATKRLFAAVRFYVDTLQKKPTVSIDSTNAMTFPKIGSNYYIATAGQKAAGRGDTIHRAHLSEAAFYDNYRTILAGISEAAEYGQIDIESTPNGRNEFYDDWQKAKAGLSPYTAIFIPWFYHEEYTADVMEREDIEGLSAAVQELFAIPDAEWQWTDEEKDLYKRVLHEHDMRLTVGQMKWRRYKIWDKGDLFFQEYPEDDESCFLQAGRAVFKKITMDPTVRIPLDDLTKMKEEDRDRLLGNKEKGIKKKMLYAGLDPAEGTLTGDAHSFCVIEAFPQLGKAYVIYRYSSNEPIDIFATKVEKICSTFNVLLGVEKQGVGVAMCRKLDDLGVAFEEWNTTSASRPILVTELEEAYRKEELVESYPEAEAQARNMVYNEKNRPEHPTGKHDDDVFAGGIAYQMLKQPVPSITFF